VRVTPVASYLTNGLMRAQVTMERIGPSWAQPDVMITQSTSLRPNTDGVLLAATSADVFYPGTNWAGSTNASFTRAVVAGGAAPGLGGGYVGTSMNRANVGALAGVYRMVYAGRPLSWYQGATYVEWADADDVWWPLVGTAMPEVVNGAMNDLAKVRFGSGLVRAGADNSRFGLQRYDGAGGTASDFHPIVTFDLGINGVRRDLRIDEPSVLVNTPTLVSVRYGLDLGGYATVSMQRGHSHCEVEVNYALGTAPDGIFCGVPTGAATAITGGIKRSTDDATGNRWAILAAAGTKKTTSPADISAVTASGISNFGIYLGPDASVASEGVARYFASVSTQQRVIA
jgi:hypothetical protein